MEDCFTNSEIIRVQLNYKVKKVPLKMALFLINISEVGKLKVWHPTRVW